MQPRGARQQHQAEHERQAPARPAAAARRRCRSPDGRAGAATRSSRAARARGPARSAADPGRRPGRASGRRRPRRASGASTVAVARRSAISGGLAAAGGGEGGDACRRWPATRRARSPQCSPVARPGPARASVRLARPSGLSDGDAGGGATSSVLRRSTISWPRSTRAVSACSSSSGSFISQCAVRRSSSACGPPPSWPRDHSQIWSDSSSATRPSPTRSSSSSGAPSGPLISASPLDSAGAMPAVPRAPAGLAVRASSRAAPR